jgi:predicted acetyltransferase
MRRSARFACTLAVMNSLTESPRLVPPTATVRESYLAGEQAMCLSDGTPADSLDPARADFDAYVDERRSVRVLWDVPCTTFWYVSGEHYIGTLVIRHRLTPELTDIGGHIGYHVVPGWRRQGHATRMLAAGLLECGPFSLSRVLLTCTSDNEASRRVILANGGVYDDQRRGEDRFWITLGQAYDGTGKA